jgi:hypothetical protein
MNKAMLAVLNDTERLLLAETEPNALAGLDEDATAALHDRIRRARNKYVGLYRRAASARVPEHGARGAARARNTTAATKAEAFEDALARVSRRLSVLAHQAAVELRTERLEQARAATAGRGASEAGAPPPTKNRRTVTDAPAGDRGLRSPATEKRRGGTRAVGARRQAKRDNR